MTRSTADVVVIGGGIIGLSIAHQIRRRSSMDVVVVEKAAHVAEGSTGASSAILRHRYTHDDSIRLARDGIAAYRRWSDFTGLEQPRAHMRATGVLWMLGDAQHEVDGWVDRMQRLGVDAESIDATGVRRRYPSLSTCGLPFDVTGEIPHECVDQDAFFVEPTGGYFDPVGAAQDLHEAFVRGGGEMMFGAPVVHIRIRNGALTGVDLAGDRGIDAPIVVNAAGPWAPRVFEMAQLPLPWDLVPSRAQVVYRAGAVAGPLPVFADASTGIYGRPEGASQILFGSIRDQDEREEVDPDAFVRNVDAPFRDRMLLALHHRLPGLEHRGAITGVAGVYTVNRGDVHPIIGETALDGFLVANGFSGHGFKEAPAVGSLIARLVTGADDEFDTDADPGFFSIDREPIHLDDKAVLA